MLGWAGVGLRCWLHLLLGIIRKLVQADLEEHITLVQPLACYLKTWVCGLFLSMLYFVL